MPAQTGPTTAKSTALSHVTICDLSGHLAGAGSTRFLAAFGARVIRVEDPVRQGRWDIIRGARPYVGDRRGLELSGPWRPFVLSGSPWRISRRPPHVGEDDAEVFGAL